MTVAQRLAIIGRVQGVGFRAFVAHAAARHAVRGWVRNRIDGSVEALLIGEPDSVRRVTEACDRGPFSARVDRVEASAAQDDGTQGFVERPTV